MHNEKKYRVALTGGSGTLGRNFLELIAQDPCFDVLCLLREGSRTPPNQPRRHFVRVNFNDQKSVFKTIKAFNPNSFIHAAATGMNFPKPKWFDLIRFNVSTSLSICESVSKLPDCHFIYISTGLVYKDQRTPLVESAPFDTLHPYGASKAAADILVRSAAVEFGAPLTVLRPFSFTGLWDDRTRLFPSLLRCAAEGQKMKLSVCDQRRDHCSARDIAEGIRAAILTGPASSDAPRSYNLGSGSMASLRTQINKVVKEIGLEVDLEFGARDRSPYEPLCLVADTSAAARDLGWRPRHNLAHAVWQLARESFPQLKLKEPREDIRA